MSVNVHLHKRASTFYAYCQFLFSEMNEQPSIIITFFSLIYAFIKNYFVLENYVIYGVPTVLMTAKLFSHLEQCSIDNQLEMIAKDLF